MTRFADHFSDAAAGYARFRPGYPESLFDHLAALAPARNAAWDCGTGSGQAAVSLGERFGRVLATDASAEQIAHAAPHPRVEYRVAPAERSGLPSASVELVTVAQALHWFHLPSFAAEARRVLRPGGVLAVWCYGRLLLDDERVQRLVDRFYERTVGPYWPPERRLVEEGYRSLALPMEELEAPPFALRAELHLEGLLGYLGTWSATRACVRVTGRNPLEALRPELAARWGDPLNAREVRWPLALRLGTITSA